MEIYTPTRDPAAPRIVRSLLQRGAALAKPLGVALLLASGPDALAQHQHGLPLVLPASNAGLQGQVRIVNHSSRAGTVRIHAIDDSGERFGPVSLPLGARQTRQLTSTQLERGGGGLPRGVGDGTGDWRLEFVTTLDIEPLAYVRTGSNDFLASVHEVVPGEFVPAPDGRSTIGDSFRHHVRLFHPASDTRLVSRLRLVNPSGGENRVTITGRDDRGRAAAGAVRLVLPPWGARTLTAQQLERGAAGLEGRLGDGTGSWQLFVSTASWSRGSSPSSLDRRRPIQVMSLLFGRPASLTNLSAAGIGNDPNRGGPGTDWISGGRGNDVLNPGDNNDSYDWIIGSAGNDRIVYTDSGPTAYQGIGYHDLRNGISATINGVTNRATIHKGRAGRDVITDITNPLDAAREAPWGGFGLEGTPFDDRFTLTLDTGQWMEVRGLAGRDTYNIRSGSVRINYRAAPGPVDVDLGAGRARNDGYGSVDTIIGDVRELQGGPHDDTLRGSNVGDRLDGGPGNDILVPGDGDYNLPGGDDLVWGSTGNDRIVYTDSRGERASQYLDYGRLETGRITATIDGSANRATVNKGAAGVDTIVDIRHPLRGGGFVLDGTSSNDVFNLTLDDNQWMQVEGGAGNDRINIRGSRGWVRVDYQDWRLRAGVDVDLAARRARDDGFGNVDTIIGNVWEVRGSDFDDVIRGSARNESFIGRGGNDVIDGRGGRDRLRFDRFGVGAVRVDLRDGTATGTWSGNVFSYRIRNIEDVRGSRDGDDRLYGSSGDDRLYGRGGDDVLDGREGSDRLYGEDGDDLLVGGTGNDNKLNGGAGRDTFRISFQRGRRGVDTIEDFTDGEDRIDLNEWNIPSHSALMAVTRLKSDGNGIWIDLSRYGGRGITLWRFSDIRRLDASDFLL